MDFKEPLQIIVKDCDFSYAILIAVAARRRPCYRRSNTAATP